VKERERESRKRKGLDFSPFSSLNSNIKLVAIIVSHYRQRREKRRRKDFNTTRIYADVLHLKRESI
jgi:hypothetical protein